MFYLCKLYYKELKQNKELSLIVKKLMWRTNKPHEDKYLLRIILYTILPKTFLKNMQIVILNNLCHIISFCCNAFKYKSIIDIV